MTRAGTPTGTETRQLPLLLAWGAVAVVGAFPLAGQIDVRLGIQTLPALAVGGAGVLFGPSLGRRVAWRPLLLLTFATALAWALALALVDGWSAIAAPLQTRYDYLHDVPRVGSAGHFLSTFTDRLGTYAIHVRGHPPGIVLVLWTLDRIGLGGSGWAAALVVAGGAAAAPAAMVAVREVAGETWARAAAPFLALAPAAVWIATSADALFAGVSAWSIALLVLATRRGIGAHPEGTGSQAVRRCAVAGAGGVLFGASLFLSYGLCLLAAIPITVAAARHRWSALVAWAAGTTAVVMAFALAGFWWLDGLFSSIPHVRSTSSHRAYLPFVLLNLAVLVLVLGPAAAIGLLRLRGRSEWLLVAPALLAVLLADASGLSKGEVERIWLPFVPWLVLATGSLWATRDRGRIWLAAQVLAGVAIQTTFLTPW
jgi:hypothetical protein